jgi:hypothetical protein
MTRGSETECPISGKQFTPQDGGLAGEPVMKQQIADFKQYNN